MPEEEQQQSMPMGFGNPINSMGSTVLVLTDTDETVRSFRLMVEGKQVNSAGAEVRMVDYNNKPIEPMMNSYGVAIVSGLFKEFLTKNTSMSNIDDIEEVDRLRNHQMERVVETLMQNRVEFGIANDTVRSNIAGYIVTQTHVGLKQPYENGLKVWLGKTTQEITQKVNQSSKNNDSGWFSFLNKN